MVQVRLTHAKLPASIPLPAWTLMEQYLADGLIRSLKSPLVMGIDPATAESKAVFVRLPSGPIWDEPAAIPENDGIDFDSLKLQYRKERERYASCANYPLTDKQRAAWAKERNDRQAIANAFNLPAPHDQTEGGQAGLRQRI